MIATRRSRHVVRAGIAAAALMTLAACSGLADDAPTDASVEDFCAAYLFDGTAEETAQEMAEVGTPEGVSDEVRNGFETYVDALNDEGDTANADVLTVEVPEDDRADGEAFVEYVGTTCAGQGGAPTEAPTDAPS